MHSLQQAPQENKKIWWLIGSLAGVFLVVIIWVIWPKHPKDNSLELEAQSLLKNNSEAISSASFKNPIVPQISAVDHIWGNSDAKLGLIVYEDLSQSFAVNLDDSLEQLKKDYGASLKIAYRSFPATGSLGARAGLAFECAFLQEKGWEYRQSILGLTKNRPLLETDFLVLADQLSLDKGKFQSCLADEKKAEVVDSQIKEAAQYGVFGSPTLFVGEEMINGARPLTDFVDSNKDQIEGLKTIIERKLK